MQDKLSNFWQQNKKTIIQVSGAVVGGLVGVGLTMLILSGDDEFVEMEEEILE